jgi:hypothetical protein
VSVGYFDASAVVQLVSSGPRGDRGAAIWSSFDAGCTHALTEVEVPCLIGRTVDRMAWVWVLHSLSVIAHDARIHTGSVDLAWLGAPTMIAVHVAAAEATGADTYVCADEVAASWAEVRGLNVVLL